VVGGACIVCFTAETGLDLVQEGACGQGMDRTASVCPSAERINVMMPRSRPRQPSPQKKAGPMDPP